MATIEATVVVELGIDGNPQGLPDMHGEGARFLRTPLGIGHPGRTTRHHVNGIEARHACAAGQIVRHNIDLTQLLRRRRLQMGIDHLGLRRRLAGSGHPSRLQHPLDAGDAGQRLATLCLEPGADRRRPDVLQAGAARGLRFQRAARQDDLLPHCGGQLPWHAVRGTGLFSQTGPRRSLVPLPPFAHPTFTAAKLQRYRTYSLPGASRWMALMRSSARLVMVTHPPYPG